MLSANHATTRTAVALKVLLVTFISESLVMFLLPNLLPDRAGTAGRALANAALLTVLAFPFLWWFIMRPKNRLAAQKDVNTAGSSLLENNETQQHLIHQSNHDWEDAFNTITDMITIHDKNFNIIGANKAAEKILGLPVLDGTRAKCYKQYHGSDHPPAGCPSCVSLVTGKPSVFVVFEQHLNMFIEIRAIPRIDAQGSVVGLIHVVRDISARNWREDALLKSENRLRTIIETVPECVMLLAADGTILDMNQSALAMIAADSISQAVDTSILPLIVPEYRAAVQEHLDEVFRGNGGTIEYEFVGMKGARSWVETRTAPLKDAQGKITMLLGICRDITEHKKLEAQLRHAQKMEAIGTLSGGIAHDFNNILTAIIGYSNILKLKLKKDDTARPFVEQILASADRATGLTQSLLAFSRKMVTNLAPMNLNETVQHAEKLLRRIIGEDIELKTVIAGVSATVVADSGQIDQVLMNLVTNARDAMPEGGTITITAGVTELGNEFIRTYGYGKPGTYAVMSVTDTGIGIDEKFLDRIFEPFFTTKEVGRGTGLGLSIVYGIIKSHNGYINCSSRLGHGTTFTVYLPLTETYLLERQMSSSQVPQGGNETILLAEDDAEVRKLSTALLRDFGYTIIDAENGEVACRRFREHQDAIHLLLFDVIMPTKNGKEAYDEIRLLSPNIKVIFMSGYSTSTVVNKCIADRGFNFIQKPVSPEALLIKIRKVLDT